jgi:hypothetical protein
MRYIYILGVLTSWYLPQQNEGIVSMTKAAHDKRIRARLSWKMTLATIDECGCSNASHTCYIYIYTYI